MEVPPGNLIEKDLDMLGKEQIIHINLMNWISYNYPEIYEDTYHFANERRCSIQQGLLLKKMGVKSGVSDLFIAVPRNGYAGLWIELKSETGKLAKNQSDFISRMLKRGYHAVCVWSLDSAKYEFKQYISC